MTPMLQANDQKTDHKPQKHEPHSIIKNGAQTQAFVHRFLKQN